MVNPRKMTVCYDSFYKAQTEFWMSDTFTLQMLGIVTSKNNLSIGMVYPRLNYLYSCSTQLTAGMSFGSAKRLLLGAKHIFSNERIAGIQTQYCLHLNKLQTSLTLKDHLSKSTVFCSSLHFHDCFSLNFSLSKGK